MMRSLRIGAYVFALAAIAITVLLTVTANRHSLAVAVLGGTLAVTPYVVVRAIEEMTNESGLLPRS
jgi:hypothetical protein